MDPRFLPHNLHLSDIKLFSQHDPHLYVLSLQKYQYFAPIINQIPRDIPGIYTLCGGRQVGKSTLLKQWMLDLLHNGVNAKQIAFMSGEIIDDHHALIKLISYQLNSMPHVEGKICYLILDEITYIKDWDKGIKYLADTGLLRHVVLVITGSDLQILQEARLRFPGRRGKADQVNFHLHSLSFKDFLILSKSYPDDRERITPHGIQKLYLAFNDYLIHGGYLTAINEYAKEKKINIATLDIYSEWIRGDMIKRDKREHYLQEIIQAIIKRYNTQVSWINLAQDLSIDHPQTVADYISSLESMDAVFVQHALMEDKLIAAPKKHKKVMFTDPFIFHALNWWINPSKDPFNEQILSTIQDSKRCSSLVESVTITHLKRMFPTYYIKANGEVDLAYVKNKKFWPIEVKWTHQLRAQDLKQIQKYSNAQIWAKVDSIKTILNIKTIPIPLALIQEFVIDN